MARAGADVVGVNCHFGPFVSLQAIKLMKEALNKEGLKVHLMVQPLGYLTPDAKKQGFIDLKEFPFALEPRVCTRWDMHRYAREAYEVGVRYIGGCCGFEPYHIRAIAEELAPERGRLPEGSDKSDHDLSAMRKICEKYSGKQDVETMYGMYKCSKDFWLNMEPATG